MTAQYEEYSSRIPKEVRLAVDGLGGQDDLRYAIVMLLIEREGEKFNDIKKELEVHSQSLSNALKDLQRGGIVEKKSGERIGVQSTGEYTTTEFGDRIIEGLYHASQPTNSIGSIVDTNRLFKMIYAYEQEFAPAERFEKANEVLPKQFLSHNAETTEFESKEPDTIDIPPHKDWNNGMTDRSTGSAPTVTQPSPRKKNA